MAHNPHAHLQREIDSLRKQLIQERDQRRYEDNMLITTAIAQAEERVLERCIVECMEEANAPTYTEEERIAILTAVERLKERRAASAIQRKEEEHIARKQEQEAVYQQVLQGAMQHKIRAYNPALNQASISGVSITRMVMDEDANIRWSNVSNPEEWVK